MLELGAIAAAVFQLLGYVAYISFVRRGVLEANPLSWLMFAYGTTILALLEYGAGATFFELLLPVVCAASSVVVAILCAAAFRRHPLSPVDWIVFAIDVILTILYVALTVAKAQGVLSFNDRVAVVGLLIASNFTTLTAFIPLLRSTYARPGGERVLPWMLWTTAYSALLLVTIAHGAAEERLVLLLYPASNAVLHLSVALLALSRFWRKDRVAALDVRHTDRTGLGLFTTSTFQRGEYVCTLAGSVRRWRSRNDADAGSNENWIGIGKDIWIEPDAPFMFINHSCEPNLGIVGERDFVALRDIGENDELTFDYSITEDEPHWSMPCSCGRTACRKVIGPVWTLPYDVFLRYLPCVPDHFRRRYLEHRRKMGTQDEPDENPRVSYAD